MDQNLLLVIMAVFVAVSAIALCIQAGMLYGLYNRARAMEQTVNRIAPKVEVIAPKVELLVESTRVVVDDSRQQIAEITSRANDILDATRRQLVRVDDVLEDAAGRVRIQLDRAEMVLDDAMNRAQETVAVVHSGIMRPLREIQGVAAGVRGAIQFLARGNRPSPAEATADEEMFI